MRTCWVSWIKCGRPYPIVSTLYIYTNRYSFFVIFLGHTKHSNRKQVSVSMPTLSIFYAFPTQHRLKHQCGGGRNKRKVKTFLVRGQRKNLWWWNRHYLHAMPSPQSWCIQSYITCAPRNIKRTINDRGLMIREKITINQYTLRHGIAEPPEPNISEVMMPISADALHYRTLLLNRPWEL